MSLKSFNSVQFSRSVVSDSLRPHEPQHAKPPCPSPTPGVHPNPCPSSRWCHSTISSSVVPFSSCPQSFPASRSFQMSQLFASGGQSIGVSASKSSLYTKRYCFLIHTYTLLANYTWVCVHACIITCSSLSPLPPFVRPLKEPLKSHMVNLFF